MTIVNGITSFVRTFPGLSIGITALLVMLPVIIELVDAILRLRGAH